MISINVTSFNGATTAPLSGHFDEMGGNIGRAENNQLVLPDPERTISRVHAQVVYRNGRYAIVDRGSNPISVNGRPLGNGQEAFIQAGDELNIGGYVMRVEAASATGGNAAADPFADFAGLAAAPAAGRRAASPIAPASASVDPLAGFGGGPASSFPAASAPAAAGGIPQDWDPFAPDAPAASPGGSDFARSLGQPSNQGGNFGLDVGGRAQALIPEFGQGGGGGGGGGDSLDALFGLGSVGGSDPLAGSALNQAAAQPNMAANADPMKSLNSITRGSATAAADTSSELSSPFMLPPLVPSAPHRAAQPQRPVPPPSRPMETIPQTQSFISAPAMPASPAGPPPAAAGGRRTTETLAPQGSVLSWSDPSGDSVTVIGQRGSTGAPGGAQLPDLLDLALDFGAPAAPPASSGRAPVPVAAAPIAPARAPAVVTPSPPPPAVVPPPVRPLQPQQVPPVAPAARSPSAVPAAAPVAANADIAALTAALREGLAVPGLPPESLVLTPTLMRLMGRLLHEATRGTVDLLVARQALKREIRAEVTMIVTKENNPLKFSPSAEVALGHLLQPPARGFMEPDRAMRDAYDDLRAHQFGFLAGMRAALEGILKRFDPAILESKLTQKSVLSTLLPAKRKARMWDVFTDLYGQISSEASDDFHELFGKEFLRAYNEHIDQLSKDRP